MSRVELDFLEMELLVKQNREDWKKMQPYYQSRLNQDSGLISFELQTGPLNWASQFFETGSLKNPVNTDLIRCVPGIGPVACSKTLFGSNRLVEYIS